MKIATAEKAILDILNFQRTAYSIDLVLEKLREYQSSIDIAELNEFSRKQSSAVQRILGFLFDKTGIDSSYLYDLTKGESSSSRMTRDSQLFNAKWRLYYHKHFE